MKMVLSRIFALESLSMVLLVNPLHCFIIHTEHRPSIDQRISVRLQHERISLGSELHYRNDRNKQQDESSSSELDITNIDPGKNGDKYNNTKSNGAKPNDKIDPGLINDSHNIGGDPHASLVCEKQLDYVGAGTLGDIMSDPSEDNNDEHGTHAGPVRVDDYKTQQLKLKNGMKEEVKSQSDSSIFMKSTLERNTNTPTFTDLESKSLDHVLSGPTKSGLVTSTGGTLTMQFGTKVPHMSPLDRIALTANGNLQRIFSSYYDAPVHVHVDKCVKRQSCNNDDDEKENGAIWNRTVHISVFDQIFCKATSIIAVRSYDCIKLVESGEVGIGQLFRYLDKLPTFTIVDAGRCKNGGLWRKYTLECNELTCDIVEEFVPNAWNIEPNDLSYFNEHDNTF